MDETAKQRKFVVIAEKIENYEQHSECKRRTAVFDGNATLEEVFSWLRYENEGNVAKRLIQGENWWNARLSLHEDDNNADSHLDRRMSKKADTDELADDESLP